MVVRGLYLMMVRSLELIEAAPAGSLVAISGLEGAVLRAATLSSTRAMRPFAGMVLQAAPIVRVALEPESASHLPSLEAGLGLLQRADPFVEVRIEASGELVVGAAGEVHLERCLLDLRTRFAPGISFKASPPLVAFRESCAAPREDAVDGTCAVDGLALSVGAVSSLGSFGPVVEVKTPGGRCILRARAGPLPGALARVLEQSADQIAMTLTGAGAAGVASAAVALRERLEAASREAAAVSPALFVASVRGKDSLPGNMSWLEFSPPSLFSTPATSQDDSEREALAALLRRAWSFGPHRTGPNVLLATSGPHGLGLPAAAASLGLLDECELEAAASLRASGHRTERGRLEVVMQVRAR